MFNLMHQFATWSNIFEFIFLLLLLLQLIISRRAQLKNKFSKWPLPLPARPMRCDRASTFLATRVNSLQIQRFFGGADNVDTDCNRVFEMEGESVACKGRQPEGLRSLIFVTCYEMGEV